MNDKNSGQMGHTALSFFKQEGSYFELCAKPIMINFRVKGLVVPSEESKKQRVETTCQPVQ
jgi:hypothetical protein